MAKLIVGIMGPAAASTDERRRAFELGSLAAQEGWVVLTGGRRHGVMHAALEGARSAGGLTVGVLPTADYEEISPEVDIPIVTGLGDARNQINVLTSHVIFVCGMSPGTASEVAFALKTERPVILVAPADDTWQFWRSLDRRLVQRADTPLAAITAARSLVG
jgi:uncharacterized protein (TIGR00725 family)